MAPVKAVAPHRAAFAHESGPAYLAHCLEGIERDCRSARNMEFLFCPNNQVEQGQGFLQLLRYRFGSDKAVFTITMP